MKRLLTCLFALSLLLRSAAQEATFKPASIQKSTWGSTGLGNDLIYHNSSYSNFRVKYFVLKKDSTETKASSKIYKTENWRFYLSTENKESSDEAHRIYADQTIRIYYEDQRY
jgi:hypothetical protein